MARIPVLPQAWSPARRRLAILLAITGWPCLSLISPTAAERVPTLTPDGNSVQIRDVRVLILSDVERVRIRSRGGLLVTDENGDTVLTHTPVRWLTAQADVGGGMTLGTTSSTSATATIAPLTPDVLMVSGYSNGKWSRILEYNGRLSLHVTDERALNAVNLVDPEQYVAAVVAGEIWPTFSTEAFRAQAVVARTFVVYQMGRRNGALWDVTATQGSQVYSGIRKDYVGRRASEAARSTRGVVCTWDDNGVDRLFSTYYSSVCGGMSQSAEIFGEGDDIAPLAGGVQCDYCRIAPAGTYRWGPFKIETDKVVRKLLTRYPELKSLGDIVRIAVARRSESGLSAGSSRAGRPVLLKIKGSTGKTHEIVAERFRLAVGSDVMPSTDCDIRIVDGHVVFSNGRGFGHGLGLCQWGMQGQALAGKRAGEIIRYYYPGSRLTRAY